MAYSRISVYKGKTHSGKVAWYVKHGGVTHRIMGKRARRKALDLSYRLLLS